MSLRDAKKKARLWHATEATVLTTLALSVWGLFSLPAVFYLGQRDTTDIKTTSIVSAKCTPVQYMNNQSLCYSVLQKYKGCNTALNQTSGVQLSSSVDVQGSENALLKLYTLKNTLSGGCQAAIFPFICLYLFPLCDDNNTAYPASSGECDLISKDICKAEWSVAQQLGINLPNCALLPKMPSPCNLTPNISVIRDFTQRNITCSQNFNLVGNYCLPACPDWKLRSSTAVVDDVIVVIAAAIGLISSIMFLVVSCLRYDRMFKFPSVLVIYQVPIIMLLVIVTFINFINPKALYCTAPDWIATLNHPSKFCAFTGTVLVWCLIQISVIWIAHVSVLFSSVMCPVHYMVLSSQNRMRYIHILIVLIGVTVPAIVVAVIFTTGGFINARFPPLLCLPRNAEAGFYAIVLPLSVIMPSGISLLLAVFFTLRKRLRLERAQESNSQASPGSADKKIFVVFCYFLLLGIMSIAAIELNAQMNVPFVNSMTLYFGCERAAQDNCDVYKTDALKHTYHEVTDVAYVLLALFPLVSLMYAFNFGKWKILCCTKTEKNIDTAISMVEI